MQNVRAGRDITIDNSDIYNYFESSDWRRLAFLGGIILLVLAILGYTIYSAFLPKTPKEMTGSFNVAVTEFLVLNENGKELKSDIGYDMAEWVTRQLSSNFAELDFNQELWGPELTGKIMGKTRDQRAVAAAKRAEEINAHILVYGVIQPNEDGWDFKLEFYISYIGFREAPELIGDQEFGKATPLRSDFDPTRPQEIENRRMSSRVEALTLTTIGLAYYSIDDYEESIDYFIQAVDLPHWVENTGKEVVYLLLGNAYIRSDSINGDGLLLDDAEAYYLKALEIDGDYLRAKVGLAGVHYLRALGPVGGEINETMLDLAEKEFLDCLTAAQKLDFDISNIAVKSQFSLAQINVIQAVFFSEGGNDREEKLNTARNYFNLVIEEYKAGNNMVSGLASDAYARLGDLARFEGNIDEALDYYKLALGDSDEIIASPFDQGEIHLTLGELYEEQGNLEEADREFQKAIDTAEEFGNRDKADEYRARLEVFRNSHSK